MNFIATTLISFTVILVHQSVNMKHVFLQTLRLLPFNSQFAACVGTADFEIALVRQKATLYCLTGTHHYISVHITS